MGGGAVRAWLPSGPERSRSARSAQERGAGDVAWMVAGGRGRRHRLPAGWGRSAGVHARGQLVPARPHEDPKNPRVLRSARKPAEEVGGRSGWVVVGASESRGRGLDGALAEVARRRVDVAHGDHGAGQGGGEAHHATGPILGFFGEWPVQRTARACRRRAGATISADNGRSGADQAPFGVIRVWYRP